MAIEAVQRMRQIVKVADARKQRLAKAAIEARRKLDEADNARSDADLQLNSARTALENANVGLLENPSDEQMLIWRDHCAENTRNSVAHREHREEICAEAARDLTDSLRALQRQDLRHEHLAQHARKLQRQFLRREETKIDDEAQGSGQQSGRASL
jgi:hypothetical protein